MRNDLKRMIYKISPNPTMNFLNSKELYLEKDILTVASIIFNIETAIRMGKKVSKVNIPISKKTAHSCDLERIKDEIIELLTNVLIHDIEITFEAKDLTKYKRHSKHSLIESDSVCLFSGGVDSFSGILNSYKQYGELWGVFVAHGDQSWAVNIVNNLSKNIDFARIHFGTLYAPKMRSLGYSQLRGFLYCLYGSIYANLVNAKRLIIAECGPTMYQPQFSPFDTVTMTTHPFVLNKAKNIIELFLNRAIDLVTPFEDLTKSEVISISPHKELIKDTHSCISLRFGRNEGTCYGCITRRLGFVVAGVEDTTYKYDPITNQGHNADNLISLLRFSHDILLNYENMPFSSKESIYVFDKYNLFYRFALDTFAALYLHMKNNININPHLCSIYKTTIENIGENTLEKRIEDVRNKKYKPDFSKII